MALNPEAAIKGLDKRVNSMEKILDSHEKQARQADYTNITKKLEALEKKQETIGKKVDNLEKAIITVAASLKDPKKFVEKAGLDLIDKDQSAKIAQAVAQREGEKLAKDAKTQAEKMVKDMNLDVRLKVIEAKLASLGR